MKKMRVIDDYNVFKTMEIIAQNINVHTDKVNPPALCIRKKGDMLRSRFFYIVKGSMLFDKGKKTELLAKEGDIIYLPADITYISQWITDEGQGEYISFNCNLTNNFGEEIIFNEKIAVLANDKRGEYYKIFSQMNEVYCLGRGNMTLELKGLFYKFLADAVIKITRQKLKHGEKSKPIYRGILYLENNYTVDFPISELAKMCNMSETHFRRVFKKYKNMSPVKYRNQLRLNHAKKMLETGLYTVSEVAEIVNFSDVAYFSNCFKREFNINPSEIHIM